MIYKYKIYLNMDEIDTTAPEIFRRFTLKDNYVMDTNIKIDSQCIFLNINIFKYDTTTKMSEKVATLDYRYVCDMRKGEKELLKICKAYLCSSLKTLDVFMIRIFSNDIMEQLDNNYNNLEMLNEIKFTDFNNNFELMDLCALMLTRHMPDTIKDLFIQKIAYFGYRDLNEIIGTDNLHHAVKTMLKKVTSYDKDIVEIFCDMATIDLNNNHEFSEKFLERLNIEYYKISYIRVKYLEADFII